MAYSALKASARRVNQPRVGLRLREYRPSAQSSSNFEKTSSVVKGLVAGLTGLVNAVVPPAVRPSEAQSDHCETISPQDVFAGVRSDFTDNCYLWTGQISDHIYADDCTFTDPTLSFTGLQTFKRNLASLTPILDRLLATRAVELRSCELREGESCVVARWRMTGQFRLPWRPVLDLNGQTTFTYDAAHGGRVLRYDEEWGMSAAEALLQLVRPGPSSLDQTTSDKRLN